MTADPGEFLDAAGAFLRLDPARNTVLLTVTENFRARRGTAGTGTAGTGGAANPANPASPDTAPLFGWWEQGTAGAAFMHTPPFPVVLTAMAPGIAAALAAELAGRPVAGVNAGDEAAEAFAGAWTRRGGAAARVHRRMRLFRLAGLAPPGRPDGGPRIAGDTDRGLLCRWYRAFEAEVHETGGDAAAEVGDRLGYGGLTLWEAAGVPVSFAGVSRRVAGMVRVGPVYTPPELRGRGYACAVTAEVSRAALAAGAGEVLLYTDLANPTSNALYQRIGYRAVEDRLVLAFGS